MASSGSVYSQTLQEITNTKLEELAKKRHAFEKQKAAAINKAEGQDDHIDMLTALADGCKECFGIEIAHGKLVRGSSRKPQLESDLCNLGRFLDQARFDPSVSSQIIDQWKRTLYDHLETQSLKYTYADLYGKMVVEWLTSSASKATSVETDAMDMSHDFEEISSKKKLESRRLWEEQVFQEATVDRSAIENLLKHLFSSNESQKALKELREDVSAIETVLAGSQQFNNYTLGWTIKGLLNSDLLTNEKRQVLRDFQSNQVILTELADVLNMRLASFKTWSWGSEVSVEARRQLNGRFKIYMHEDLLQAIFLQYLGVQWSVHIKQALMKFQRSQEVWKDGLRKTSPLDSQRRQWFMPDKPHSLTVQQVRSLSHRAGYFMSQLMDSCDQDLEAEEGEEEADFRDFAKKRGTAELVQQPPALQKFAMMSQAPPAAARSRRVTTRERYESEEDEDMGFGLDDDETPPDLTLYKPKNPMDAKQRLLHLLSTEILVKTKLTGEITCLRSQIDALEPSLPHATVEVILSYFGVSTTWLKFFKTFLQAPLKFLGEDEEPRLRKRGTPGAHVLSDFFGEIVLFCLDFAINQQTEGELLWRLHDDLWFWSSSHETCVRAWKIINTFNSTMGLKLDESKSAAVRMQQRQGTLRPADLDKILPQGQIRWGMIYLDDSSGRFTIDRDMVDKHIEELRKQLKDKERSIMAWVQAYSIYASTFFTTNFGKLANCFGREHLDTMLAMHERIQKTLFSKGGEDGVSSVVDWLKKEIERRFGVKDIPDGYLFFPTSLGGLEVKSPFIGLLQLRESVTESPDALLREFLEAEQEDYKSCKKRYLDRKAWEYPKRESEYRPRDPTTFMPFDEYSRFREELNYGYKNQLVDIYQTLLKRPVEENLENQNTELHSALNRVQSGVGQSKTITTWYQMTPYWKWVTMLYGPEMMSKFGGFDIVDAGLLPMGMSCDPDCGMHCAYIKFDIGVNSTGYCFDDTSGSSVRKRVMEVAVDWSAATQIDHIIILLSAAQFQNVPSWLSDNFKIIDGGTHSKGTSQNKLIIFKDGSYIELFSWVDPPPAGAEPHADFPSWAEKPDACIIDWALTGGEVFTKYDALTSRLKELLANGELLNVTYDQPLTGGRRRKDGEELRWATVRPRRLDTSKDSSSPCVPFFCHDISHRILRVPYTDGLTDTWPDIVVHPCGAVGIANISIEVPGDQLESYAKLYEAVLGNERSKDAEGQQSFFNFRVASPAEAVRMGTIQTDSWSSGEFRPPANISQRIAEATSQPCFVQLTSGPTKEGTEVGTDRPSVRRLVLWTEKQDRKGQRIDAAGFKTPIILC